MKTAALLIIDIQEGLLQDHPTNEHEFINNVNIVLKRCRNKKYEIIFVRHQDSEDLIPGSTRWEITHKLQVQSHDKLIDKKFNSAFLHTNLHTYLQSKYIDTLILVGMQTEFCVDATCKSAFEHGYHIIIPENCVTTFDNTYMRGEQTNTYYYEKIWDHRFATIGKIDELL